MKKKRRWTSWINIILMTYGLIGIAVYYLQDNILFHPVALAANYNYNFKEPFREVNIPFDSNANINIIQFTTSVPSPKGVVLYLHGNRDNIGWYEKFASNFTGNGYEVWMIDYPGYGKSTGPCTEPRLYEYANQLYLLARAHFMPDSIIIYGKSLGTGIAAWLASRKTCKTLVLESPYYSMTHLAGHYFPLYPVGRMIHYKIPTCDYIRKIIAPITILHGTSDWIIPYGNSEKLAPLLKPGDKLIPIPGGSHNNLNDFPLFHQILDSLLH